MKETSKALSRFHPLIARWFLEKFGRPTPIQEAAWENIASGAHVLITASTGTGKTLAAFLWAIDRLITGEPVPGTRILYISPLKALNNDVRRNLTLPLEALRRIFEKAGAAFPEIRVLTRSGDTPSSERRRMERRPPEILITTPESLNLLLSSMGGRSILRGVATVILDEIHAVVGNRRGVHLMTAVERLALLSGEFQRIAISATVRPRDVIAEYVGGYKIDAAGRSAARPVRILSAGPPKVYDLAVRFPEIPDEEEAEGETLWEPLARELKRIVEGNRSTLLFVNSRRLSEKLTRLLNTGEDPPLAYAHHGSLSREIREAVERKLKSGDLRAIVATHSLELGIDIGTLDQVVLIQSPFTVSSAVQRIGRSGHRVGEVSRGIVFPTHSRDFIEAAVLAAAVPEEDIEAVRTVESPLDVLAQIIVSMTGAETWDIDSLYERIRAAYPFRSLSRAHFDLVLDMLAGRYAETRIRELTPRILLDPIDRTVSARRGGLAALFLSGGTIPDRGYYHLRHQATGARIGELDEEFVWEARIGQTFALGTQSWKIERITHNDVFVSHGNPGAAAPPFWRADENDRDFHFSERIGRFLEMADRRLAQTGFHDLLCREYRMDARAAERLIAFLKRQKDRTRSPLPHRHHLLVEQTATLAGESGGREIVLHTFWGGRVNRPYALALEAAWEERFGRRIEIFIANDCLVIAQPDPIKGEELLSLVSPERIEALLRKRLEGSGFFAARFRECAGRALLLPRGRPGERIPLWMSRLRSRRLLDSVRGYGDFPILIEAWRTCLNDAFDIVSLKGLLAELDAGEIGWSEIWSGAPSPMAAANSWARINRYLYSDDEPASGPSSLREDLLRDLTFTPGNRPEVGAETVRRFEERRQRLFPGYAPDSPEELLQWLRERLAIPVPEWEALLSAVRRDHKTAPEDSENLLASKTRRFRPSGGGLLVVPLESLPRIAAALAPPPEGAASGNDREEDRGESLPRFIGEWLRFYGPVSPAFLRDTFGLAPERLRPALEDLLETERIVTGRLVAESAEEYVCDAENFTSLLRLSRRERIPAFDPLPSERLQLFLARFQGIADPDRALEEREARIERLFRAIERLACLGLPAELWETEVFPARLDRYDPSLLDTLFQEGDLRWVGTGRLRTAFCTEADYPLFEETRQASPFSDLFRDGSARYDFRALLAATGLKPETLSKKLWEAVWRGDVGNDTYAALRRGMEQRFKPQGGAADAPRVPAGFRPTARGERLRWAPRRAAGGTPSFPGGWFRLPEILPAEDPVEREDRRMDRARILLDRYGILFRELLERELPPFRWSAVFPALLRMELSGEILSGYFFHGPQGPQFITRPAFMRLRAEAPVDTVYWINAADPASLCGIRISGLRESLPRRSPATHLVFRGARLAALSRRNGRILRFHLPPEDPLFPECLDFLHHLLSRPVRPLRRIPVETINGRIAPESRYLDVLRRNFEAAVEFRTVVLYRKIR